MAVVTMKSLLLNLVHRKMTAPRLNYEDFEELRSETLEHCGESSYLTKVLYLLTLGHQQLV